MSKATTALILGDLQNDFIHPNGAYGEAGQSAPDIAAVTPRLAPLVKLARERGILTVATLFTLVPGRGGEPIISPHLKQLRPFLKKGDFAPGAWGQQLIDELFRPLLARYLATRGVVAHVGSNTFLYYRQYDSSKRIAPDVYVLPGVPPSLISRSWKLWQLEQAPSFALEVVSTPDRFARAA